ncbi:MAG TPA: hypothetical protein DCG19_08505 [Cryomorphaceae bacterium]|nr:hypothetical protein [Owenweeksia sp.]MBF97563.1 hypothetical protein [Owenweeksia sp.]HAD97434.1 hypothetical protein [Cryomorphaceae bacterium]HBF21409.1 hypothetical protein [Cryomorphaceae bacterium]|tara:strand:+ start:10575 stop:12089 length:1515 start_codon:yes stop_codon:yes gene_type:complete
MKSNLKISMVWALGLGMLLNSCQNPQPAETETQEEEVVEATPQYIRKNAADPAAAPDVQAMATAFEKLRQLPCSNPVSWYYQGAIHWVPNNVPNGNPLCPEYQDSSQIMAAWMNCTHADGSELHFLIWHRLYIYYLEKIIRQYSGKSDFALPYWDYTNTSYRVMPDGFRQEGSSLYASARLDSLNEGFPIQPYMDKSLDVTDLFENRIFSVFNSTIDRAPHGAMHNYIGASKRNDIWNEIYQEKRDGLMAEVSSAAFDPIFWLHHSNIDYLWQKWEDSPNGSRPSLEALEAHPWGYTFFDADGSKVEFTVAEAYEMAFNGMNYTYDVFDQKQLLASNEVVLQDEQEPETVASSKPARKVNSERTQFAVDLSGKKGKMVLKSDNKEYALLLTLKVSFTNEPDSPYEVYIREQGADDELVSDENLAGIMTFFGAEHHATEHGNHHAHGHTESDKLSSTFTFDVTDELDQSKFNGKLDIEILRKGQKVANEEIVVEEISLQKIAVNP